MRATRRLPRSVALACVLLLGGCGGQGLLNHPPQVRGNRLDPDTVAEIVPGTATRADVAALFGTPTLKASFDDNTWLYISEQTRPRIGATNSVLEQTVVAVRFDQTGKVLAVDTKTREDGVQVGMVDRATPSPGTDASFLQQLFGNIGRFNPGMGGGAKGGTGASSSNY